MKAKIWTCRGFMKVAAQDQDKVCAPIRIESLLKAAGFTIMAAKEVRFPVQGYSAAYILAESHFALHTFPEENKIYFELSSCNKAMYKSFKRIFKSCGKVPWGRKRK